MLEDATDQEQRAEIHYWLWALTADSDVARGARDRAEALLLYRGLIEKTAKHEYLERIEELASTVVSRSE